MHVYGYCVQNNIVRVEDSRPPFIQTKNEATGGRGWTKRKYIHEPGNNENQSAQRKRQGEGQIKRLVLRIRDEMAVSSRGRG